MFFLDYNSYDKEGGPQYLVDGHIFSFAVDSKEEPSTTSSTSNRDRTQQPFKKKETSWRYKDDDAEWWSP